MVFHDDFFYVFGGEYRSYKETTEIYRLSSLVHQWEPFGNLKQNRRGSSVVVSEGKFIVVGGREGREDNNYNLGTETCTLNSEKLDCEVKISNLSDYSFEVALFPVDDDFCKLL